MNKPIETEWTVEDVLKDYILYQDKKIVAKRYCISVKEVTEIVKAGK